MHAIYTTLAVTVMIIVSDWIQCQIYRQYTYIFSESTKFICTSFRNR